MTVGTDFKDITKTFMPLTVAVVAFLAAFQIGITYNNLTSGSSTTQTQIDGIKQSLSELTLAVNNINKRLGEVPSDVIRKVDLLKFCLYMERNNKGFSCPGDI